MSADVRELTERVEALLGGFEPREPAEELVRALLAIYGEGLARVLAILRRAPDGAALVASLCEDPFVASLLLVHDLHPAPLAQRVEAALASVRPTVLGRAGDVRLLGIAENVVSLELSGTCSGCSAAGEMLKRTIENAIYSAAPEIVEIRSEALNDDLLPKVVTS